MYEKFNWNISRSLKVIDMLLGLQIGYAKFAAFYLSGTAEIIAKGRYGLHVNLSHQGKQFDRCSSS